MTAGAVEIRRERPDQAEVKRLIEALDAYSSALYPPESTHHLDVASLCAPSVAFLVARVEGEAVGCGALLRDPRGFGEIKRMYVRPDQRGRRVGAQVLAELEAIGRGWGVTVLRLETGIHNHEALAVYRRTGFRERGPFGDYGADPLSVFMEKDVTIF